MTKLREVLQFEGLIGQTTKERRVKVLLIGEGGAGKSEMLRRIGGEEARGEHVQTRVAELSGVDIATVGAQAESWSRLESFSQSAFVAENISAKDLSDEEIQKLLTMEKPEGFQWHEEARRKWKEEEKKRHYEMMMMMEEQKKSPIDDANDNNIAVGDNDNNDDDERVDSSDGKQKKTKSDALAASSGSSSSAQVQQKNEATTNRQEPKKDHWILMVWDCGGQHVYHSAHKIFMNNDVVYCMVVRGPDLTSDDVEIAEEIQNFKGRASQDFAYWIVETVRPRAPDARVLVIVTHLDKWRERKKEVLRATREAMRDSIGLKRDINGKKILNDDFVIPTPFALDSWSTSDEAAESIKAVREMVLELGQILLENRSVPSEWLVMHDRLEMRREQWRKHPYRLPFMTRDELKDDLDKLLTRDSTDQARNVSSLEEYLVRTGSLVRAPKSDDISDRYARAAAKNAKLDDKLFFDPHWLMEVLRAVIDDEVEEYSDRDSDSELDSDLDSDSDDEE